MAKIEEMVMAKKVEVKELLTQQFAAALERVEREALLGICQGGACANGSTLMTVRELFPEYDIRPEITREIQRLLMK
jgi:hypothetical protein